ncbi:MAG: conserved phage C-terminal domain-containing protein [Clostridium sp.]|uniref:conserved phage C-terminal domain-containing protein n=1 Tax=Clostridium sp. TaxID=1506 RepID=UPI003F306162
MNKFIFGFNQEVFMEEELDLKDLLLLKYINDVILKKCFLKKKIDGEVFYWIKMDGILEAYPGIALKKPILRRRLKNLVEKGFLDYRLVHGNGTFSFYKKGKFFENIYREDFCRPNTLDKKEMSDSTNEFDDEEVMELKDANSDDFKVESVCTKKSSAMNLKVHTNNNNNKQVNNYNNILYINKMVSEVVEYLNLKIDGKYSKNNSQTIENIKNLISDGYDLEDFKAVVDKKYDEWKDTEYEKYVRPYTLFKRDKFENYLNQREFKKSHKEESILGFVEG